MVYAVNVGFDDLPRHHEIKASYDDEFGLCCIVCTALAAEMIGMTEEEKRTFVLDAVGNDRSLYLLLIPRLQQHLMQYDGCIISLPDRKKQEHGLSPNNHWLPNQQAKFTMIFKKSLSEQRSLRFLI